MAAVCHNEFVRPFPSDLGFCSHRAYATLTAEKFFCPGFPERTRQVGFWNQVRFVAIARPQGAEMPENAQLLRKSIDLANSIAKRWKIQIAQLSWQFR